MYICSLTVGRIEHIHVPAHVYMCAMYTLLFPQKSVESIVATLNGLMNANLEELRIIQTMLLLVTSTDVVQGKSLTKVS